MHQIINILRFMPTLNRCEFISEAVIKDIPTIKTYPVIVWASLVCYVVKNKNERAKN